MRRAADEYPYYPFLISAYSTLALAAANVGETVPVPVIAGMVVAGLGIAAGAVLIGRIVTRDRYRSAYIGCAVLVVFQWYGYLRRLTPVSAGPGFGRDAIALIGAGVVTILIALGIHRTRAGFAGVARYLNRLSALLLLFPLFTLTTAGMRSWQRGAFEFEIPQPGTVHAPVPARDIYFLMLDGYSGSRILSESYGYDNSGFEKALVDRGFVVPTHSRANYVSTYLALASMLNWEYLDTLPKLLGVDAIDRALPYRLVEENRAARYLRAAGYRFVFFPTTWSATIANRLADTTIARSRMRPGIGSALPGLWLSNTIVPLVTRVRCATADCRGAPFVAEEATGMEWKFSKLRDAAAIPGPKFVFAHVLAPHEPFVFNRDCTHREPYWPTSSGAPAGEDQRWRAAYVAQVECLDRMLLSVVDAIRARSAIPPVIILQADHGHGRFERGMPPPLRSITELQLRERADIFAAYHVPGAETRIYDSITPVNVFRVVLSHYFGANLPLLEDRTYYSSFDKPYEFVRVDSLLNRLERGGEGTGRAVLGRTSR